MNKRFRFQILHHFLNFGLLHHVRHAIGANQINVAGRKLPFPQIHFEVDVLPHASGQGMHVMLRHVVGGFRTVFVDQFVAQSMAF